MHPGYPQQNNPGSQGPMAEGSSGRGFAGPQTGQPGQQQYYGGWQGTPGSQQISQSSQSGMYPAQNYQQRGLTPAQQQVVWNMESENERQNRKQRIAQERLSREQRHAEFRQRQQAMQHREKAMAEAKMRQSEMEGQPGPSRVQQPQQPVSIAQYNQTYPQNAYQQYQQQQSQQQAEAQMYQQQNLQQFQQQQQQPMDAQSYQPKSQPPYQTLQEHALEMRRQRQFELMQQQQRAYQQQNAYQQRLQQSGYPQGLQQSGYPMPQPGTAPQMYPYPQQQDPQSSSYAIYQQQQMYEAHKRQELARQQQQQQAQVQQQQNSLQLQGQSNQQYQQRQADTPGSSYTAQATPQADVSMTSNMSSSANTPRPPAASSAISRRTDVTDVVEGELDQFNDILYMTDFGEKPLPPVESASGYSQSTANEITNALASMHSSDEMRKYSNIIPPGKPLVQSLDDYVNSRPLRPTAIFGARPIPWRPPGPELDVEIPDPFPEDKENSLELLRRMLEATVIQPTEFDIQGACSITMQPPETPEDWCHIHYYEFADRLGEPFRASGDELIIDGLCAPSTPTRLCLGNIGNPSRDPVAVAARRQVGRGCRITRNMQDLSIESLSDAAIFIQAPIHAESRGDHYNTIYRLPSRQSMRLFDYEFFNQVLQNAVTTQDYDHIYKVQNMCHIRMSFVKGFGGCYRREQIHYTPCWIEIHLTFPLQCVDRCLFTMKQTPPPDARPE